MGKKSLPAKVGATFRKIISAKMAPFMVFNSWRIFFYRLCGYQIGKNVFIGMRCYLDDLEPKLFTVEDNAIISYGCFFACHGKGQGHYPITIKEGAYLGMRCNVISKNKDGDASRGVTIGKHAIVGACSLVNCDVPDNATAVGVPCRVIKHE